MSWDTAVGNQGGENVEDVHYNLHDDQGRLLKHPSEWDRSEISPEDVNIFISKWQRQHLSSKVDWKWTSKFAWPDIHDHVVVLKRFDLFERYKPHLQQGTTDIEESRRIRQSSGKTTRN